MQIRLLSSSSTNSRFFRESLLQFGSWHGGGENYGNDNAPQQTVVAYPLIERNAGWLGVSSSSKEPFKGIWY